MHPCHGVQWSRYCLAISFPSNITTFTHFTRIVNSARPVLGYQLQPSITKSTSIICYRLWEEKRNRNTINLKTWNCVQKIIHSMTYGQSTMNVKKCHNVYYMNILIQHILKISETKHKLTITQYIFLQWYCVLFW